jgi:hypothetical protein
VKIGEAYLPREARSPDEKMKMSEMRKNVYFCIKYRKL